jgi:hypothetical protein
LDRSAAVNKLLATLTHQGILREQSPKVLGLDKSAIKRIIQQELTGLVTDEEVLSHYAATFEAFSKGQEGKLLDMYSSTDGKLVVNTVSLEKEVQDKFNFSMSEELVSLGVIGLDAVVKFKVEPPWWGPLVVFLLGVAQLVLGAVCCALGAPNIGMALISEGVGDIIFATDAQVCGNFSWSAYMEHKLISSASK